MTLEVVLKGRVWAVAHGRTGPNDGRNSTMKESSLNELSDHERESCWWEMSEAARFDGAGGPAAVGSV